MADHSPLHSGDEIENDSSYANLQPAGDLLGGGGTEQTVQQHLLQAKHSADLSKLQHALSLARSELRERRVKNGDTKHAARAKVEEVVRTYQSKLASVEAELRAAQDRVRMAEKSKSTSAKELEENLAQTISLYSLVSQHQNTIEQQRIKCEYSDAQFAAVSNKLKAAEKELVRLRLLLEKEHDSNERHISALKGQLSMKTDEVLQLQTRLATLEEEYAAHKSRLDLRIESLEKDRSILEAVNFELRSEREKNYALQKDNEDMKETVIKKAHLEGQHAAALEQIAQLSITVSRLEDERAQWVGERRDLDHQLGDLSANLKQMTIERDALTIDLASRDKQLVEQSNEHQRRTQAAQERAEAKEAALTAQLAERDALITRAQQAVEQLQADLTALRAERKALLDSVAALEAQVRELSKAGEESREQLATAQAKLAETLAALDGAQAQIAALTAQLEAESLRHARSRTSRFAVVEKLDQGYEASYTAQIFGKWKHEHRVQEQLRALQRASTENQALQAERAKDQAALQSVLDEKAQVLAASEDSLKSYEASLAAERASSARALAEARAEWQAEQIEQLAASQKLWEREREARQQAEIEEGRQREERVKAEREKIRAEVEEARKLEVEALRAKEARENAVSIARRPSIQSMVGHQVEAALRHHVSPPRGAYRSHSPPRGGGGGGYHRGREDEYTDRSFVSRTTPSEAASIAAAAAAAAHRSRHADYAAQHQGPASAVSTNLAASMPASHDSARAEERRRTRSKSGERRHRHHHHHHSNEVSPHGSRHHRSSSHGARVRSSSPPPVMPPLTQMPFALPANFAQFVQAMHMSGAPVPMMIPSQAFGAPAEVLAAPVPGQVPVQFAVHAPVPTKPESISSHSHSHSHAQASHSGSRSDSAAAARASAERSSPASNRSSQSRPVLPSSKAGTPPPLSRAGSATSSAASTSRKSLASVAASSAATKDAAALSKTKAAAAKVPPLPLHHALPKQTKSIREAAKETTFAAGSPLDTQDSPSPSPPVVASASPLSEHEERARLAEGLDYFLAQSAQQQPRDRSRERGSAAGSAAGGLGAASRDSTDRSFGSSASAMAARSHAAAAYRQEVATQAMAAGAGGSADSRGNAAASSSAARAAAAAQREGQAAAAVAAAKKRISAAMAASKQAK